VGEGEKVVEADGEAEGVGIVSDVCGSGDLDVVIGGLAGRVEKCRIETAAAKNRSAMMVANAKALLLKAPTK
jgi:hypothetical protein